MGGNVSKNYGINTNELLFVSSIWAFICLLFMGLFTFNLVELLEKQNPLVQFGLITIGLFLFVYGIIRPICSIRGNSERRNTLSVGSVLFFLAMDIPMPGFHVLFDGTLLRGDVLGMGSTDYAIGYMWSILGFTGFSVFALTYLITCPVLLFVSAYLLTDTHKM